MKTYGNQTKQELVVNSGSCLPVTDNKPGNLFFVINNPLDINSDKSGLYIFTKNNNWYPVDNQKGNTTIDALYTFNTIDINISNNTENYRLDCISATLSSLKPYFTISFKCAGDTEAKGFVIHNTDINADILAADESQILWMNNVIWNESNFTPSEYKKVNNHKYSTDESIEIYANDIVYHDSSDVTGLTSFHIIGNNFVAGQKIRIYCLSKNEKPFKIVSDIEEIDMVFDFNHIDIIYVNKYVGWKIFKY